MKRSLIVLPVICLLFFTIVSFGFGHPEKSTLKTVGLKQGFAVVELFTSEGCSSCPPADEAVAALTKDYPSNVYVLGFHVDYWNYLGWKDEFSSADNTSRQQAYAEGMSLSSIYTPQVIVNGKTEFTGSDKNKLYTTVKQELSNDVNAVTELTATAGKSKDVLVNYKTSAGEKTMLYIALVQLQANSTVKRGENKGKLLHHVDVVRSFKAVNNNNGTTSINLPEGLTAKDCKIIVFVQQKNDLHITGAGECRIQE